MRLSKLFQPYLSKQLILLSLIVFLFLLLGTLGFWWFEDMDMLSSFWLTIMTLTTVGYGVPEGFTDKGVWITIFLMLFGVGIVLYSLSIIAIEILNGNVVKEYKNNKMIKQISQLKNHVIICGFGRNGRQAARKLQLYNTPYIVIDKREFEIRDDDFKNTIFLNGDATIDEDLKRAGIERASGLIAALPSDADNLFIVLSSKQMNPNLKIVSRASNSNSVNKLKSAGADNIIMPDKIGGEHMASLLVTPDLVEFMDNISLEGTKNVNLLEISTNKINPKWHYQRLIDLDIRNQTGCRPIGYKNDKGQYIINPDDDMMIEKDGFIIVLGRPEQISSLNEYLVSNIE